MKNLLNLSIKCVLFLSLTFSFTSCQNDDYDATSWMIKYGETTDYYGSAPDPTQMRNELIGKWYDDNGKLVVNIIEWRKNPDYDPMKPSSHEYEFKMDSKIDGYTLGPGISYENYWWAIVSQNKNNTRVHSDLYFLVEGQKGKLFVVRNQTEVINIHKQ